MTVALGYATLALGLGFMPDEPFAVTMRLKGKRLRSRFLRNARSEPRAYPKAICERRATKRLRKKIQQARPIQLHGHGLGRPIFDMGYGRPG